MKQCLDIRYAQITQQPLLDRVHCSQCRRTRVIDAWRPVLDEWKYLRLVMHDHVGVTEKPLALHATSRGVSMMHPQLFPAPRLSMINSFAAEIDAQDFEIWAFRFVPKHNMGTFFRWIKLDLIAPAPLM